MNLLHAMLTGVALLILVYLGVKNAPGIAQIFNAGGPQINNTIKTLQGR